MTRARDLRLRLIFAIFVAFGGALVGDDAWPPLWLVATMLAQVASLAITEPLRRDPGFQVSRRREVAFFISLALSATVFAACGPLLWFCGGSGGRLFAVIVLAGGAVNAALQAGDSAARLWVGCAPFILLLQGLPLVSFITAPPQERGVLGVTVFAATLIILHLALAGHRGVQAARKIKAALEDAHRERLRAEAASAAKSDFLGVMSHELKTPLNGVLGMAQALEADEITPAQRARVEVIRQSGEALLVLLDDLLDISRIETARLELAPEALDLALLAAQTREAFGPLAAVKALGFEVRLLGADGGVRLGDPGRVRQVLHNLVANAVKFTDFGAVSVLIIGAEDEVVFEVADTGPGIPSEQQAALFERFGRTDLSSTRRHAGPGLGLTIARGLAEAMGGEIAVRSAPGEGSVFTARLALPAAFAPAAAPAAPAMLGHGRLRVLAAEDNPTNQLVLKTLLEQAGVAVHMTADGEAAVEAWRSGRWDLVLMDIQMPVMDGVAATQAIRALEAADGRPRTPIVAVTANVSAEDAARYVEAGVDGLAPKPIQFSQLLAVVSEVIGGDPPELAGARSVA